MTNVVMRIICFGVIVSLLLTPVSFATDAQTATSYQQEIFEKGYNTYADLKTAYSSVKDTLGTRKLFKRKKISISELFRNVEVKITKVKLAESLSTISSSFLVDYNPGNDTENKALNLISALSTVSSYCGQAHLIKITSDGTPTVEKQNVTYLQLAIELTQRLVYSSPKRETGALVYTKFYINPQNIKKVFSEGAPFKYLECQVVLDYRR